MVVNFSRFFCDDKHDKLETCCALEDFFEMIALAASIREREM
jgi:hypothetical protein